MEKIPGQQPADCQRIVLFGPESTGKTTLAEQLALHFNTQWVPEYMRSHLQQKWDVTKELISKEDLMPIAVGQMELENATSLKTNRFLFCDTNLRQLKVYCKYYYGNCPKAILEAVELHSYDHYFLTSIEVPWEADDLRDRPYDRSTLFRMFEAELQEHRLPYTQLVGNEKEQLQLAIQTLEGRK